MSLFCMSFVVSNLSVYVKCYRKCRYMGREVLWGFFLRVSFVGDENLCASIDTQGLKDLKGCSITSDRRSQTRDL